MGKKSSKTIYYEYYISMDFGLVWGPVDELVQVYFKEKKGFDKNQSIVGSGFVQINKPNLFGGFEREGGIVGTVAWRHGTSTQLLPSALAAKMGVVPENAPGYRDIACLAYYGDDNSDRAGGSVSTNNPNVPAVWARIRRSSKTMGINTNVIPMGDLSGDDNEKIYTNANPAAMLHEVITLPDRWAMGADPQDLDSASWNLAAQTLFDEKFGLSCVWTKQTTIEAFSQEVLDHINGMVFFNPFTAKVHLKLIRDDYDRDLLNTYGPDTCKLTSFKRKLWGETINEIVVTWTNPESEEDNTITYQDPGNIAMQGDNVSANRNYYMIRDVNLASTACKRDLQAESAPLATVSFKVDRTQWKELPGDCIKFQWPEYNIDLIILRVLDIDWGTVDDSTITVNCIEDIFSFTLAEFAVPGPPEWEDPGQDPDGPNYFTMNVKFFSAPLSLMQQDFGQDAAPYLSDAYYPQIVIAAIVTPIPPVYDQNGHLTSGQPDLQNFHMWVPGVATTGEPEWQDLGEKQLTGKGVLKTAMVQEVRSDILVGDKIGGDGPEVGRYAIIGDAGEEKDEWVLFEEKLPGAGNWRVRRGVLDTTPKTWAIGTPVYFISLNFDAYDTGGSIAGSPENYKLQPRTSEGLRDLDGVQVVTTTRPARPYFPYRPANVKLEGIMFGGLDDSQKFGPGEEDDTHEPRERWQLHCTWSRRNRFLEENVVLAWDAPDMVPEDDQETNILIYSGPDGSGEVVDRLTGFTGTEATIDIIAATGRFTNMSLKFISFRDGYDSLQGHIINLQLYLKGFGSDWGYVYGGWPKIGNVVTQVESDFTLPFME